MLNKNIFLILAFVFLWTNINASKNLFSFTEDEFSTYTENFIRLKNRILAYSSSNQLWSINLDTNKPTQILNDTINSCGSQGAVNSRLLYHDTLETLVYYCTGNNSLLILDQDSYNVQDVISAGDQPNIFPEIRMYIDGNSVVILGLTDILEKKLNTIFIKIDLFHKALFRTFTFDSQLAAQELVRSFAVNTTSQESFIVTQRFDYRQVKIYKITFTNPYTLTPFATINCSAYGISLVEAPIRFVDQYLVTNDNKNLLLFNDLGQVVYTITDLAFSYRKSSVAAEYYSPMIGFKTNTDSFYVQFINETVYQFFIGYKGKLSSEFFMDSVRMQYAVGNKKDNDLLFIITKLSDLSDHEGAFDMIIYEPRSFKILSQRPTSGNQFLMGKSNMGVIRQSIYKHAAQFDVYSLKSGKHVAQVPLPATFYFDYSSNVLFYVNYTYNYSVTFQDCDINYYDLDYLSHGTAYSIYGHCDSATLHHVRATIAPKIPDLAIHFGAEADYVYLQRTQYEIFDTIGNLVIPDYDNKILYGISYASKQFKTSTVLTKFAYNETKNNFEEVETDFKVLANTTNPFKILDSHTVASFQGDLVFTFDLAKKSFKTYQAPYQIQGGDYFSGFENQGKYYVFISPLEKGIYNSSMVWVVSQDGNDDGELVWLDGQDDLSNLAAATGICSYVISEDAKFQGLQSWTFEENENCKKSNLRWDLDSNLNLKKENFLRRVSK